MLECYLTANWRQRGARRTKARLRYRVENVTQPIDRKASLMEVLPHLRQAQHRHTDARRQHVEGHQFTDGQIAVDDLLGTEIEDRGNDYFVDHLHGLACRVVQSDDAETRRHITSKLLLPAALHLWLDGHGFERLDASDALDQKSLILRAAAKFLVQPPTKHWGGRDRERDIKREGAEHHKG